VKKTLLDAKSYPNPIASPDETFVGNPWVRGLDKGVVFRDSDTWKVAHDPEHGGDIEDPPEGYPWHHLVVTR